MSKCQIYTSFKKNNHLWAFDCPMKGITKLNDTVCCTRYFLLYFMCVAQRVYFL